MGSKRFPRGAVFGLLAGLLTLVLLNWLVPGTGIAAAQDEDPTPTPEATEAPPTATPLPTPIPTFQMQAAVELLPDGDLNGDGLPNPGDTLSYTITVINTGDTDAGSMEVDVEYDSSFISGIAAISDGGISAEEGLIVWTIGELESGEKIELTYSATLRGRFPSGRTQVTGLAFAQNGNVKLGQTTLPPIEVVGPNLRVINVSTELITDALENGRIDPGDTIQFTIDYLNSGGGPSQEASLIAAYPADQTRAIISNPDNGEEGDGQLAWAIGSVPADNETHSVKFTIELSDEFPSGVTTYDLQVFIRGETSTLDETSRSVPVFGANLTISPRVEFLADADGDGLADPGDIIKVIIPYENVGTESALNIRLDSSYSTKQFEISLVEQSGIATIDPENGTGTISWTLAAMESDGSGVVSFQATVLSIPAGLELLEFSTIVESDQTGLQRRITTIPADSTGASDPDDGIIDQIVEISPPQGQGLITGPLVALLIGIFLTFSLISIVFVGSRVLPNTAEERDADNEEDRIAHRRMVRELLEGVILVAILFSVMILGLQNALDQDSVNSIIAGIVGYVAGRVASQK